MKIAVVSHSLVAERQQIFWGEVNLMTGFNVLQVGPNRWGVHSNMAGYDVDNENDMVGYTFGQTALRRIEEFKPDILYVQNEAYCAVTSQMRNLARRIGSKFAVFVWENLRDYKGLGEAQDNLRLADLVVCGNGEALRLVEPYSNRMLRCIQVGVNSTLFQPERPGPDAQYGKDYDIIFQGRRTPEKGVVVLENAIQGTDWKVLWPEANFGTPYGALYKRYSRARVHASPSLDTPFWKEQHGAYANIEALMCGLYVATSDSDAIVEGLQGCPGVFFSKRGNAVDLHNAIGRFLEKSKEEPVNSAGMEWAIKHYSSHVIGEKLLEAFGGL